MPHLHGKSNPQQACGKCSEDCPTWEGIFCSDCGNWHHVKCEQLEIQNQQAFKALPDAPYICKSCRSDEKGMFSYDKSLNRLHKAAKQGFEKLSVYVERERLFMKEELSYSNVRVPKYSSDVQAQALLQEYCPVEKRNAAKVSRDNNSLFSAVSVALTGTEKLTLELRVRCCIEMVMHDSFYRWQERYDQLSKCAPDFTESCLNCATPDEDSCVWTMSALASVVRRYVESIYPAVNGKMDCAISILNAVFTPRNKIDAGENLKIFWSSSKRANLTPGSWVPDTFVPLVDMPMVTLSPMVMSPYSAPSRVSGRMRKPTAKVLAITSPKERNHLKVVVENSATASDDDMNNAGDSDFEMPSEFTLEPADDEPYVGKYRMDINVNWMDKFTSVAKGGMLLQGIAFLSAQEIFNTLISEKEILPNIPAGRKEDVYFVVDNSRNMRYKNRRNYFVDDCGRYNQKSGTTCKSYYLLTSNNILQPMIKNGNLYCRESKRVSLTGSSSPRPRGRPPGRSRGRGRGSGAADQKVTKWIPMSPQPNEEEVVVLHRYYSSLEIDPTYKRRISWFMNLPDRLERGHNVFVAEYLTKPVAGVWLPLSRKRKSSPEREAVSVTGNQSMTSGSDAEGNERPAKTMKKDSDEGAQVKASESDTSTSAAHTESVPPTEEEAVVGSDSAGQGAEVELAKNQAEQDSVKDTEKVDSEKEQDTAEKEIAASETETVVKSVSESSCQTTTE